MMVVPAAAPAAQAHQLRSLVQDCIAKHLYSTAVFFADKLVSLTGYSAGDVFLLAQVRAGCGATPLPPWPAHEGRPAWQGAAHAHLPTQPRAVPSRAAPHPAPPPPQTYYVSHQFRRAAVLLRQHGLMEDLRFGYRAAKCLAEVGEWDEVLALLADGEHEDLAASQVRAARPPREGARGLAGALACASAAPTGRRRAFGRVRVAPAALWRAERRTSRGRAHLLRRRAHQAAPTFSAQTHSPVHRRRGNGAPQSPAAGASPGAGREGSGPAAACLLRGRAPEALDNRAAAAQWYQAALRLDPFCEEALAALLDHHLLTNAEELALVDGLKLPQEHRCVRAAWGRRGLACGVGWCLVAAAWSEGAGRLPGLAACRLQRRQWPPLAPLRRVVPVCLASKGASVFLL